MNRNIIQLQRYTYTHDIQKYTSYNCKVIHIHVIYRNTTQTIQIIWYRLCTVHESSHIHSHNVVDGGMDYVDYCVCVHWEITLVGRVEKGLRQVFPMTQVPNGEKMDSRQERDGNVSLSL